MAEKDLGKGVAKFIKGLRAQLEGKLRDQLSEIAARTAAGLIQRRTRSGLGVALDGGATFRLKPLSPSYIEYRKRSRLSSFTTPSRSNLTFTGQMLGSIGVKRAEPGNWVVLLQGTHTSGVKNEQLAKYVSRTRPFMFLSGGEVAQVQAAVRRNFATLVKS